MANAQFIQLGPFFSSGALVTSPKLYHYAAGTATLKNIWSDRGESSTLAQPFVGDANGIFNFFADGLYKFIIKDSDGNTLYTLDNVLIQDFLTPSFAEGELIASASTVSVGPEVWAHISGTTTIDALSGTIPFFWAVFDGALTLTHSSSLLCPASANVTVQSGDVIFFLNEGSGIWRVAGQMGNALSVGAADVAVLASDGRTNTVDAPFTVQSMTTNTPAAGIGVGILYRAESADEAPSNFGQTEFAASDVTAGSEDTYFQILLRVAGAALTAVYRFVSTTAFRAIFTHANTADRTYTLIDRSCVLGQRYDAPISTGTGSTQAHEGSVTISSNQALSKVHFYTDFTLDAGKTITPAADSGALIIFASNSITINGTIAANGAGHAGASSAGADGTNGTDQPGGGGGGGGSGGNAVFHGTIISTSAQVTGPLLYGLLLSPWMAQGGASGGAGSAGSGSFAGGASGASVVLVAPSVTLGAASTINTSGVAGSSNGGTAGGGGGGGAGNIYIITHFYTDNGCTFTQTAGAAGTSSGGGSNGSAGAAGVKQINIY